MLGAFTSIPSTYNPSIQKAEAGARDIQCLPTYRRGQPGLHGTLSHNNRFLRLMVTLIILTRVMRVRQGSSHQALDASVERLRMQQSGFQFCVLLWVCLGLVSVNCKLRVPAAAKTLLAVALRGRCVQAPSVPQGLKSKLGHGYGSQKVLKTVPKWSSLRWLSYMGHR